MEWRLKTGQPWSKEYPGFYYLSGSGLVVIWAWVKDWTRFGLDGILDLRNNKDPFGLVLNKAQGPTL